MSLDKDHKLGLLSNSGFVIQTSSQILSDVAKKPSNKADQLNNISAALACIGIALGTMAQAMIASQEENHILKPH